MKKYLEAQKMVLGPFYFSFGPEENLKTDILVAI